MSYVKYVVKHALAAVRKMNRIVLAVVVSGLAVAALSYPATAAVGLIAKLTADAYVSMPAELTITPPPQTTYVYAADGKTLITTFYEEDRKHAALSGISPFIQ